MPRKSAEERFVESIHEISSDEGNYSPKDLVYASREAGLDEEKVKETMSKYGADWKAAKGTLKEIGSGVKYASKFYAYTSFIPFTLAREESVGDDMDAQSNLFWTTWAPFNAMNSIVFHNIANLLGSNSGYWHDALLYIVFAIGTAALDGLFEGGRSLYQNVYRKKKDEIIAENRARLEDSLKD